MTTGSKFWRDLDVSPDGQWLAFTNRGLPQADLFISRTDGTGLRQLTNDPPTNRIPRWSPDGQMIFFFSTRTGGSQVWTIGADGSGLRQVTDATDQASGPVVSPDGSRLAVHQHRAGQTFTLAPDGRYLYLARGEEEADIWMATLK